LLDEIFPLHRLKLQPIAYAYTPLDALEEIGESPTIHTLRQALVDENPSVRRSAVYGLRQIDSEVTICLLLQALQDKDSHVFLNAISALKEIGVPRVLPNLYERVLITTSPNYLDELFGVTSAIQERCKFYHYTLTQPPQMEDKPKSEVKRDQVFISYSHKDKKSLEKLQTMLKPMMRNNTILVWDDTKIQAGAKWRDEIEKALARANVAVLMVSANFLASDFIAKHELPPLLNAAEQEGLKIIWVPVGYCLYKETEIEQYQSVHNPSQPLESLKGAKLNQVLVQICEEIKAASTATDE